MKKKRSVILAVQVLLVVGFGVSIFTAVHNEIKPTKVYTFKRNLPVNTKITENDVQKITIPGKAVTGDFIMSLDELKDKYVCTKVSANQYVMKNVIETKNNLDIFKSMDLSKYRKISLPINFIDGLAGNIKKGDKVDLLFVSGKKSGEKEFKYSKDFLQNIPVWSVNTDEGFKFADHSFMSKQDLAGGKQDGQKIDTSGETGKIAVITLAVSADQAEEIYARMKAGEVRVVGRFQDDANSKGSKNYPTLGYVLGDFNKVFTGTANAETSTPVVNQD